MSSSVTGSPSRAPAPVIINTPDDHDDAHVTVGGGHVPVGGAHSSPDSPVRSLRSASSARFGAPVHVENRLIRPIIVIDPASAIYYPDTCRNSTDSGWTLLALGIIFTVASVALLILGCLAPAHLKARLFIASTALGLAGIAGITIGILQLKDKNVKEQTSTPTPEPTPVAANL